VFLGLSHPLIRFWIMGHSDEPTEESHSVSAPETEPGSVRCEAVRERAGVVRNLPDGVGHDLRHRFGVLFVPEEIRGDPGWAGNGQSLKGEPLAVAESPVMDTDVRATGLAPSHHGEFVPIGWEVPKSVQRCRRPMGHHTLFGGSLPSGDLWSKLEPGGPQVAVIWCWCSDHLVDAVSDSLKSAASVDEAIQRRRSYPDIPDLLARDEPPLIVSQILEARKG
jgi:hypothetical protein